MRALRRGLSQAVLLLTLAACAGMPLRDLNALRKVDPLTTQADRLRIALALPAEVRPRAGAVLLSGHVEGEEESYIFNLVPVPVVALPESQIEGLTPYGYRIDPPDLPAFEALRLTVAEAKAEDRGGSLGVDPGLCYLGARRPTRLPIEIYLMTAELGRFVLLTAQDDLSAELPPEDLDVLFPACS